PEGGGGHLRETPAQEIRKQVERRDIDVLQGLVVLAVSEHRPRDRDQHLGDVEEERVPYEKKEERLGRRVPLRDHPNHEEEDERRRERLGERATEEETRSR